MTETHTLYEAHCRMPVPVEISVWKPYSTNNTANKICVGRYPGKFVIRVTIVQGHPIIELFDGRIFCLGVDKDVVIERKGEGE